MAAHQIVCEGADVAIGGGTESITLGQGQANSNGIFNEKVGEAWPGVYMGMGDTAEVVAERYSISRQDQDAYGLRSQQRYKAALDQGLFADEIVPMDAVWAKKDKATGETAMVDTVVDKDECNRPETTLEGLSQLKPSFKPEGGSVTAGNASQLSDGASSTVLMSAERASSPSILMRRPASA